MGTNPFSAELVVKDLAPAFLADPQSRICSVCMDLETPQTANLQVWLESPGGQILELTNFNGDGQNYTNTCFVPGSAAPVSAASPPFSGSFAPDGNWSVLTGTPVNGTWKLLLSDTTGQSVLRSWSICLGNDNEVTWQWIPDTGLSCQDCPTPLAFPEFSNTWIVEAKDRYGCVSYDSASIEVKSVLNSPVPDCSVPDEGQLLFSWSPVTGAAGYLIAVDNGPWQAPSGAQSHLVTGLADGAMVTLALTVIPQPDFCTADTVLVTCQYVDPCPLSLSVDSVSPPSCFNTADGSVTLKVQGNLGPLEYKLEAETPFQQNPEFQGLGPGTYLAVVRDSAACSDSVIFVVAAPDTLYLSLLSTDVTCHGSATGSIQSVVTNAQGALTYNWSGPGGYGSALPEAVQLGAGAYCLEIVDGNACAQTACDTIFEPSAIAIIPSLTMPRCHDTDDGALSVVATGGTPGYVVQWNDPLNTQGAQLENVTSGIYTLTVTDGAGCDSSFTLELPGPPPLVLDQIIKSQVSCKGLSDGSLLVEVSGGTPPYAYLWSDPLGQQTSLAVALEEGSYEVTITDSNDCELTASATLDAPDSISVFGSISPANCSGDSSGAISVAPQGGTLPYAFSWSAGLPDSSLVTSLPAGLYTVTVVDGAGCEGTASFEVTEPDPLVVVVSVEEASCANTTDGSAEAVVEGGTAPYALEWSQGATGENLIGIGAGLYGVTVTDALGCQFTAQALVGAPDSVSGLVDASPPSCFDSGDGSLSIAGVGGMAPFIYSLDQSPFSPVGLFQNLDAGFYKVVVQDANGCEWENEVHIIAPDPLIVDAGPDLVIELGDSIVLGYMATGTQGDIQSVWTASYSGTLLCDTCLYCDQTQVLCSEPIAKPSYTIWYTIRVVDEKGCEAEDLVKVSVEKNRDVFVPTGFTPNGDGQNDVLVVHGEQETRIVLFKIFDRWGECVFENGDFQAQDILSGWDGTFHGQPMPAGTYVWYLEAEFSDKARLIYQGETTLIR